MKTISKQLNQVNEITNQRDVRLLTDLCQVSVVFHEVVEIARISWRHEKRRTLSKRKNSENNHSILDQIILTMIVNDFDKLVK